MSSDREVVDLLVELSAIDSANPSLSPGSAGEGKVAERVVDWAVDAGLDAEVFEATPGRPSVVVRSGQAGAGTGRSLLFCGHLDTVPPGDMADPWEARIEGDRIYGRGVYDMKAGLVAALIACRDAAAAGIPGEVVVAAVADEEHFSLGVQEVLAAGVRADAAIVTEPTELAVATAHRGFVWTEIEVVGKAAHGSRPHLGVDAILKTGPILVALEELNQRLRGRAHPSLGPGALHGSLITGGVGESTIPPSCTLTIERRTLPGETLADVEADIENLLAGCRAADAGLEVSARTTLAREPFEVTAGSDIERTLVAAAERTLGRPTPVGGVSYWADAAFLSAAGIPTVLFGPSGDGAHAAVEWTDLPSAVACTRALTATAIEFCR